MQIINQSKCKLKWRRIFITFLFEVVVDEASLVVGTSLHWVVKGDAHQKILRGRGGSREPSTFYQFLPSGLRSILTDLEIHP